MILNIILGFVIVCFVFAVLWVTLSAISDSVRDGYDWLVSLRGKINPKHLS